MGPQHMIMIMVLILRALDDIWNEGEYEGITLKWLNSTLR